MARTYKSERQYNAKQAQIRHDIEVLKAVGDLMEYINAVVRGPVRDPQTGELQTLITERVERLAGEYGVSAKKIIHVWRQF